MSSQQTSQRPRLLQAGIDAFAQNYTTGEAREAALAFLEKRPPRFG